MNLGIVISIPMKFTAGQRLSFGICQHSNLFCAELTGNPMHGGPILCRTVQRTSLRKELRIQSVEYGQKLTSSIWKRRSKSSSSMEVKAEFYCEFFLKGIYWQMRSCEITSNVITNTNHLKC